MEPLNCMTHTILCSFRSLIVPIFLNALLHIYTGCFRRIQWVWRLPFFGMYKLKWSSMTLKTNNKKNNNVLCFTTYKRIKNINVVYCCQIFLN